MFDYLVETEIFLFLLLRLIACYFLELELLPKFFSEEAGGEFEELLGNNGKIGAAQ
jgi:hypothetical protein